MRKPLPLPTVEQASAAYSKAIEALCLAEMVLEKASARKSLAECKKGEAEVACGNALARLKAACFRKAKGKGK